MCIRDRLSCVSYATCALRSFFNKKVNFKYKCRNSIKMLKKNKEKCQLELAKVIAEMVRTELRKKLKQRKRDREPSESSCFAESESM